MWDFLDYDRQGDEGGDPFDYGSFLTVTSETDALPRPNMTALPRPDMKRRTNKLDNLLKWLRLGK